MPVGDNDRGAKPPSNAEVAGSGQNMRNILAASLIGTIMLLILIAAVTFR